MVMNDINRSIKSITDWLQGERPRETLSSIGSENMSSAELLAILLSSGTKNLNVVEVAKELLKRFGSLENLSQASSEKSSFVDRLLCSKLFQRGSEYAFLNGCKAVSY